MNGNTILGAALVAALLAGSAAAQKKLYRYVDKDGKVTYVDALPADAVDQARKEISTSSGRTTGEVERALTAEERAQLDAAAATAAEAAAREEEQRHQEEVMLQTYTNENDLRRAYGERVNLLKTTLESTDVSIQNVRENLATMLQQAAESELGGRKVPDDRVAAIKELHAEHLKQQQFLVNRRIELESLNAEFARMLNRYRELRNAPPAPAAAAPTLPNATAAPPPGG